MMEVHHDPRPTPRDESVHVTEDEVLTVIGSARKGVYRVHLLAALGLSTTDGTDALVWEVDAILMRLKNAGVIRTQGRAWRIT